MLVNEVANKIEPITVNYLTKRYTYMAADHRAKKYCVLRSTKDIKMFEIPYRHSCPKKKRARHLDYGIPTIPLTNNYYLLKRIVTLSTFR